MRTLKLSRVMSALCQKQTFCGAAKLRLFDHLVGERQQIVGNVNAERFCGLEIDDQLELGDMLDRQIAGLL
jgi:hypothetical protein